MRMLFLRYKAWMTRVLPRHVLITVLVSLMGAACAAPAAPTPEPPQSAATIEPTTEPPTPTIAPTATATLPPTEVSLPALNGANAAQLGEVNSIKASDAPIVMGALSPEGDQGATVDAN